MGTRLKAIWAVATLLMLLMLCAGCSGGSSVGQGSGEAAGLSEALDELAAAEAPQGVDAASWQALADELARSLELRAEGRLASAAGSQCGVQVSEGTLQWIHDLRGDYDNNGSVTIADLTPLAQHLSQSSAGAEVGSMLWRIDGNLDGEINIGDVTPIGANFNRSVSGYTIGRADTQGGAETVIETLMLPENSLGLSKPAIELSTTLSSDGFYSVAPLNAQGTRGETVEVVQVILPQNVGSIEGTIKDIAGSPVGGASVELADSEPVLSDAGGAFSFNGVEAGEGLVLRVHAEGYSDGFAVTSVSADQASSVSFTLFPRSSLGKLDASSGGTYTAPDGSFITVPAGALVDHLGQSLSGELDVWLTSVNLSDPDEAAALPGGAVLQTEDAAQPAQAALEILIDDRIGGHAQLISGETAQIALVYSGSGSAVATLKLATLNTFSGSWQKEGSLNFAEGIYSGSISHLSWFGGFGPGAQSEDPQVLVIRDDAGTYDANYNAIIADLDELAVNYTEVDFDSEVVDTYFEGEYLAAIWYRGGQGDTSEPAQAAYIWEDEDYQLMFDILEGGGKVVLFSQQHTSKLGPFNITMYNGWWDTACDFNPYSAIANVDEVFGALEGSPWGWFIPALPILVNSITIDPSNSSLGGLGLLYPGDYSEDAAELHSGSGGSGLAPTVLNLPLSVPFVSRAVADAVVDLPQQSATMGAGFTYPGSGGRAALSYGNSAAPDNQGVGGPGRYYCIGYSWNQVSVNAAVDDSEDPASMERFQLMQNILSWLDSDIDFGS